MTLRFAVHAFLGESGLADDVPKRRNVLYDGLTAANNDFFGTFTGAFDLVTFSANHSYVITGGTGAGERDRVVSSVVHGAKR